MKLAPIDFVVLAAYVAVVVAIGYWLKGRMRSSADYLTASKSLPGWVTGIAFMAANLGSLEIVGMIAMGAKYGMTTNHWYWTGAIPPMVFLGLFMVRFYYSSGVRSVSEYLKHRFDHRAHVLNSVSFLFVTVLMSGINMYALGLMCHQMLGWGFTFSVLSSAGVVVIYTFLGGLSSSIYNEVIQFFLIVFGFLPLPILGLMEVGGWRGLAERLPAEYFHTWSGLVHGAANPLGVEWYTAVVALMLIMGPSYWCTDFLLVQRALAAKDLDAARKTPLIAAIPKMLFPALVTVPGMIAIAVMPGKLEGNYNLALPLLLNRYYPHGLLGLGFTALMASFMSGMAGNVTAFNTVWTYDLYQSYLVRNRDDRHYLQVGRIATIAGTALSILAAYIVFAFDNLMDYMQLIGSIFISPFFVIFILGMFWKRVTPTAGFAGMVAGVLGSLTHYILTRIGVFSYPTPMAATMHLAIWGGVAGLVTSVTLTYITKPPEKKNLNGYVYGMVVDQLPSGRKPWWESVRFLALVVMGLYLLLNFLFW